MPTRCQDSDPLQGGCLYARGAYSEGGAYMPVNTVAKKHSNGTLADPIKSYTAATRMLLELPRNRLVHSVRD